MTGRTVSHVTYNVRTGRMSTTQRLHKQAAYKARECALRESPREDRRPDRRSAIQRKMWYR